MVGLLGAVAVLLGVAGAGKLAHPGGAAHALGQVAPRWSRPATEASGGVVSIRILSIVEIAVAAAVLLLGGRVPATLLAIAYLALTLVAARLLARSPGAHCGCLGVRDEPVSRWHLVVTGAGTVVGTAAAIWPQPALLGAVLGNGGEGLVLGALTVLLAWLAALLMTALPAIESRRAKVSNS